MSALLKPIDVIICDDIRRESNGKFLLIGVYPSGISVSQLPTTIPLSLWLVFECLTTKSIELEIEVRSPQSKEKVHIRAGFEHPTKEASKAPLPITVPFKLEHTGDASIYYKEKGEKKWILLKKFPIELMEQAANN